MHKKASVIIFIIIGLVSLYLPYNKVTVIGSGLDGGDSTDYYYDSLVDFFKSPTFNYNYVLDTLAVLIVVVSLLFSPIFSFLNRKKTAIILTLVSISFLIISFYNLNDDLGFGYYIIIIQQITLLFVIILSKNKILHLQKL